MASLLAAASCAQVQLQPNRPQISRKRVFLLAIGVAAASLASICCVEEIIIHHDSKNTAESPLRMTRRLQTLGMYIDPKSVDIKQISEEHRQQNDSDLVTPDIDNSPTPMTITTYSDLVHNEMELPKYTLQHVIEAADTMRSKYAILRYDPTTDKFTGYYSKNERWVPGCYKLMHSLSALTILLRTIFPERFTRNSPELIIGVSSGDYPAMADQGCIYRDQDGPCDLSDRLKAPVMHFGSVFRKSMFPNMIAMPMPGEHLDCFVNWSLTKEVCQQFQPRQDYGGKGMVFGEGQAYEDLTPQVIWRGTDFPFLNLQNNLDQPEYEDYVECNIDPNSANPLVDAIAIMRQKYLQLVPRWQGVVLTAEAEQEALRTNSLPKVNIKFSSARGKGKPAAVGNPKYAKWEEIGFPVAGNGMPPEEMAKFKYHIDLGGGGGTTWTGFTDKLAMPGLLFHHITPTKDYIHDHLLPWEHYVPVQTDLSDLMEKIEWAESHPDEAKKIAERATEFMRLMGTPGGYENLFLEDVVKPLKGVIEAYVPGSQGDWEKDFKNTFEPFIDCPNPLGEQKGMFRWHAVMNRVCKKWEPKLN